MASSTGPPWPKCAGRSIKTGTLLGYTAFLQSILRHLPHLLVDGTDFATFKIKGGLNPALDHLISYDFPNLSWITRCVIRRSGQGFGVV